MDSMKRVYHCFTLAVLFVSGCWVLPFPQAVSIRLPGLPPGWTGETILFTLSYPDGAGRLRWRRDLSPGEEVVYLVPRDPPAPVAAYPHPEGWRAPVPGMKCAGGVYPLDGGVNRPLEMAWAEGFLVEVLQRLTPEERAPLNIRKIREKICSVSPEDPWKIDGEALLDGLLYHRFTSATVKSLPSFVWAVPGGQETWWWGNPLMNSSPGVEEGMVVSLPVGVHFLAAPDGTEQIRLEITEEGWRSLALQGGEAVSGYWE